MAPQAGVNGVLPVAALQKNAPASAPRGPKAPQPRLKLVCRRLPPALTKAEFETILGAEWKLGAGKIDYFNYRKGKVSRDQAKPSRPSCAYVRVTQQSYVVILGDHVRALSFIDAAKSFQDPALIGPPSLEYAPFLKVPGGRKRNDNRQGTIDQDQEFKDFLESLTNPITKPPAPEAEPPKEEKVKTTPLIEALREKKANKEKSQSKSSKSRGEGKDDHGEKKILTKSAKDGALSSGDKNRRISKAEKAQAAKEAVKILNKEAASSKDGATEKTPAPERKRGNVALAKSMLQRDLGVGPTPTRRRGTKREIPSAASDNTAQTENHTMTKQKAKDSTATTTAEKTAVPTPKKERPTRAERRAFKASLADKTNNKDAVDEGKTQTKGAPSPAPTILKKPKSTQTPTPTAPKSLAASRAPPTEPAAARNIPAQPQANAAKADTSTPARPASSTSQPASTPSAPAPTSKQAFLKHANASQGITEPLIEEALKIFGTVEKVEIDKRKGFAYVDFTEPEGLQKAIAASPVKVAQGAVQVLERKDKPARNTRFNGPPTGPARGGGRGGFASRGRGRGNARGGGQASTNTNAGDTAPAATPAPAPVPTAADAAT